VLACIEDKAGTLESIVFSENYTDAWEQNASYLLTRGHEHFTAFTGAPIR
jgi:hypothetical protein